MKFNYIALVVFLFLAGVARAQTTAFTYQGQLNSNSVPISGPFDFRFKIYDADGAMIAGPLTNAPVGVTNGLFTVTLDFGAGVFDGNMRSLEIGVRTNGDTNAYAVLSPRQTLTSVPYAIQALNAAAAAGLNAPMSATNLAGTIPNSLLSPDVAVLTNSVIFSGSVTASNFAGNGAGLTNLSAGVNFNNVYFVSMGGSDANSGTNASCPLATLSAALAQANSDAPALVKLGVGQTFFASNLYVTTNVSIRGEGMFLTKILIPTNDSTSGLVIQGDNVMLSDFSIGTNNLSGALFAPVLFNSGTNVVIFHVVFDGTSDGVLSSGAITGPGNDSLLVDSCWLRGGYDTFNFSSHKRFLEATLRNSTCTINYNPIFGDSGVARGFNCPPNGHVLIENCTFNNTNGTGSAYGVSVQVGSNTKLTVKDNIYNCSGLSPAGVFMGSPTATLTVKGTISQSDIGNGVGAYVKFDDSHLIAGAGGGTDGSLLTGVSAETAKGVFNYGYPVLHPISTSYFLSTNLNGNTNILTFTAANGGSDIFGTALTFTWSAVANAYTNGNGVGSYYNGPDDVGFTNAAHADPTADQLAQVDSGPGFDATGWYYTAEATDYPNLVSSFGDLTVTNPSYVYQCGGDVNATVNYVGNVGGTTNYNAANLIGTVPLAAIPTNIPFSSIVTSNGTPSVTTNVSMWAGAISTISGKVLGGGLGASPPVTVWLSANATPYSGYIYTLAGGSAISTTNICTLTYGVVFPPGKLPAILYANAVSSNAPQTVAIFCASRTESNCLFRIVPGASNLSANDIISFPYWVIPQ